MLRVEGLKAGYGDSRVLFGIDLAIDRGEVVTLLGRNGMGKTTTVRAIFGLLRPSAGQIAIDGRAVTGAPPHVIARAGLGLVPEGRQVFAPLTVEENLVATARGRGAWTLERIFRFFPRLAERRRNMGDQLSGGEQQMLAIGRALMTNPELLVLDEATEGLAPLIRDEIWTCLRELKSEGVAILVIDKNIDALSRLADRHVVIQKGRVVWSGESSALTEDPATIARFLHL
ncbi:ABC transporter ATP-binding protein [Paracoccus ravus]|uniref:ABC transporter ATP-binding protein n=1 Tax=Paracoccus ravus TaxID=2447760 RepID=UPI00106F0609|nr:ABC transporter ATP-binding protein [Paracoccus ravus]